MRLHVFVKWVKMVIRAFCVGLTGILLVCIVGVLLCSCSPVATCTVAHEATLYGACNELPVADEGYSIDVPDSIKCTKFLMYVAIKGQDDKVNPYCLIEEFTAFKMHWIHLSEEKLIRKVTVEADRDYFSIFKYMIILR